MEDNMEWISVKDQEPPKDRDFLGYVLVGFWRPDLNMYDDRIKNIQSCSWNGNKFMESCHCSGYEHDPEDIEVTHWMPLPKPPEDLNE